MAAKVVRRGMAVYSADGAYVGRVLQRDPRFMVVGESRWAADHYLVANEDIGALDDRVVLLCTPVDAMRREDGEPWSPSRDPVGSACGVDIEPLRAGMAEIDDANVGTAARAPAAGSPDVPAGAPRLLPPSPEEARRLEEQRLARWEAEIEHHIEEEIEDYESAAAAPAC